jgi:hypothetical protein
MSNFDYDKPYDILVGHWVGNASIFSPKGTYLISTKSYVSVYWAADNILSFRESADDDLEFTGKPEQYLDPRQPQNITDACKDQPEIEASDSLRVLTYDFTVTGTYCETDQNATVSVTGRQTRPDTYQFHVIKKRDKEEPKPDADHDSLQPHHVYNSHYLPTPNDWHITGPIVGTVKGVGGVVGLAVVQNFKRVAYHVPVRSIRRLARK